MKAVVTTIFLGLWAAAALAHPVPMIQYLVEDGDVATTSAGNATENSQFAIASVGKLYTAVALARLVDRGLVSFEDPLENWLDPDLIRSLDAQNITIAQTLTMTTGLPDYYTGDFIDDALDGAPKTTHAAGALSYAFGDRTLFRPGRRFDYSNTNYLLAQLVLEAATGDGYATVIKREIIEPLGLDGTFVFGSQPLPAAFVTGHSGRQHIRDYYTGTGFGDGGLIATAPDVAAFYRAVFWDKKLLTKSTLKRLMHDPIGKGYAMGVEVDGTFIGHSGGDLGFASDVRMDLQTGAIAVVLVADENGDTSWSEDVLR